MCGDNARAVLVAGTLIVAWLLVGGCGSSGTAGQQRQARAVAGLRDTRAELDQSRKAIQQTVAAVTALRTEGGNLTSEFDAFRSALATTEHQAAKAHDRATDMRARAAEYQRKWQEEIAATGNDELRAITDQRVARVKQRYDVMATKAGEARAAYAPFMRELKAVETYLSNDLTPAGTAAAAPVLDKAAANGNTVVAAIDTVIAELNDVAGSLSTAAPSK
jgi:hypothetical protein